MCCRAACTGIEHECGDEMAPAPTDHRRNQILLRYKLVWLVHLGGNGHAKNLLASSQKRGEVTSPDEETSVVVLSVEMNPDRISGMAGTGHF